MSYIKNFLSINKLLQSSYSHFLPTLFALSEKSLWTLIIIGLIITTIFVPIIGTPIIVWSIVLIILSLIRLFIAKDFSRNREKYDIKVWYYLFAGFTLLTAIIVGTLPLITLYTVDDFHQLLIILFLVGLSAGVTKTLAFDIRIAIAYLLIMLLPILTNTLEYSILIDILLLIFIISQVFLVIETNGIYNELQKTESNLFSTQEILHEKENLLYHFLEEAPVAIFSYDNDLNLVNYNPSFKKLFKRTNTSPTNLNTLPNKDMVDLLKISLKKGSQRYKGEYITVKGYKLWLNVICFPVKDGKGNILGGIGIIEDETTEQEAIKRLEYIAIHDGLTGLLNRLGYANYIKELVKDDKHQSEYSLLIYIDLNRFKAINDSLGHEVGDKVLLEVSKRLRKTIDSNCMVSRLGGDEFIVLIPYNSSYKDVALKNAEENSLQIQKIFNQAFIIDNLHLHIQASMGIVLMEPKYDNIKEILRHADITMYHAKNSNSHIAYYDSRLDKEQKELFALQNNLAYATKNEELKLFFQPIVKMKNDNLVSAELLIRWAHPTKGLLSPEAFIPLAINAGLLSDITWWIIDKLFAQILQWKNDNLWTLDYISININAQQLIEHNFATEFLDKLKQYDLNTSDIMVEITERSLIDSFENTQSVINRLKSEGVRCAIDDFGIGYSSLSYLKKLSFHTLKIDREFIKDIEENPNEIILVSTILDLGRQFNYNIVIEGIEEKKQKDLLLELDEELNYQGFYFSKPVDANTFRDKYLKENL